MEPETRSPAATADPRPTAATAEPPLPAATPDPQQLTLVAKRGDVRSSPPHALSTALRTSFRRLASIVSLVALDLSGLTIGLYAALVLRELYYGGWPPLWGVLWRAETDWLPFLSLLTVLIFAQAGLYRHREARARMGRVIASLTLVAVIALAFGVGIGHEFTTFGLAPTAVITASLFVALLRGSYEVVSGELLRRAGVRRRAVLVGRTGDVVSLRQKLGTARSGIDYDFVGAVTDGGEVLGLAWLGGYGDLAGVLREGVDEVIVAGEVRDEQLLEIVETAHGEGVQVQVAPSITELLIQRAEYVPGQGLPLFEFKPPVLAGTDWVVKRAFDYVVSAAIVVIGLPLWLLIALAVKLSSPGPVFFRDRRVGVNELDFSMLKFRTMYQDAEERVSELESANEAGGALFKIKRDPRVTPVGQLLRRFSLDEVPQVVNVLRGEMSLVGPRPLPLRDYELLDAWHRKRYLVLPGMTGLWQISGRSNLGFDDLVRLDFYYLENWSVWMDVSILLKTVPAVLSGRGAY
jgi:exopolysaccharide biosynthesis polyprenyl glycosylphosphotransferase